MENNNSLLEQLGFPKDLIDAIESENRWLEPEYESALVEKIDGINADISALIGDVQEAVFTNHLVYF